MKKQKLKIIPLGGLHEIGKNLTVVEYDNDAIIIDCGLAFPNEDMLGVDLVLPDVTYLVKNQDKLRGMFLTHGHEDHIGGIPYIMRRINTPIYGTRLTLGLVESKLREHGLINSCKLTKAKAGSVIKAGTHFKVEFIRVNHSVADSCAFAIHTPVGIIVFTGDFKIDCTPIESEMIDLTRFGELGKKGVLALMSDSTNSERVGYTVSERSVGASFEDIFRRNTEKRIIVASFASNVHRVQQVINCAVAYGRKVAVSGRSMVNILEVASKLGYMSIPQDTLINLDDINKHRKNNLVIITTGSQGEPMSALTRMAHSDHKIVTLGPDDLIILSANPIPGNEKTVSNIINEIYKKGADVIYDEVHVSGHACTEELKIILGLVKPKFFVPFHGEYRHLVAHKNIGLSMGIKPERIFVLSNGDVLELSADSAKVSDPVPAGRVLVDGYGVGDVGNIVLRDRKLLASDGLIVVVVTLDDAGRLLAGPDIVSRGFVYVRESENLMDSVKEIAKNALLSSKNKHDWAAVKNNIKTALGDYLYEKTRRRPMILPVIMEV